jgi:hypothetical protein
MNRKATERLLSVISADSYPNFTKGKPDARLETTLTRTNGQMVRPRAGRPSEKLRLRNSARDKWTTIEGTVRSPWT